VPRRDLFEIGEIVGGAWEIRRRLGEGGMGQVFAAFDRQLLRAVAVKAGWPTTGVSLKREAQAMAAIRHASLVTVHAYGRHRDVEYVVMEHIHGASLAEHLERRAAAGARVDVDEVVQLLDAIAAALEAVHRAGILHGDVKPANVLLAPGDRVVLVDFGVFLPEFELERRPAPAGTPQYMAPEAIASEVRPGAGHLVDLYALGVLGWELLALEPPFEGSRAEIFERHLHAPPPDVARARPDAPALLARLIAELMAKDPSDRPQSAEDVRVRLAALDGRKGRERRARSPRVLVVDDDERARRSICACVEQALPRAEVLTAPDAERALELVRTRTPDLVTVDLELPGSNGVELCMYLRGTPGAERCAVVVVSGHAGPSERRLLARLGVEHVITKGAGSAARLEAVLKRLARVRTQP
jgi:serine/threonine protein kinase